MALPVGILAVRYDGRLRRILERCTYLVLAIPGLVIALSLAYFSESYAVGRFFDRLPVPRDAAVMQSLGRHTALPSAPPRPWWPSLRDAGQLKVP